MYISFGQYQTMVANDAFSLLGERRIELIKGTLREMSAPEPEHCEAVSQLNDWSMRARAINLIKVRIQNPIGIPALDSAPQPDLVWIQVRTFRDRHPLPKEVLLLIEVADSSLDYDCGTKAELYAAAGIQDYWVVSLPERLVHVYRQPEQGTYTEHTTAGMGSTVRPLALPQFELSVSELLGP